MMGYNPNNGRTAIRYPREQRGTTVDMNVLMVDSEETWRGGEAQVTLLMAGLIERGVNVALASPPNAAIAARARQIGVRTLDLPISGGMDLAAVWSLRGVIRSNRFDIVHCHSSHAHSIAFMAQRASQMRFPTSSGGTPRLVVSRRVDFPVARNGFSAIKYRYGADIYIAISNGVRDVLVESGVEPERVRIVRSGIDFEKFAAVRDNGYLFDEFGLSKGTPIVGNVAALAPHKSQVDFIKAAKRVAEQIEQARFFIVGEGQLRPKLESLIDTLDMRDRVTLTGFREDVLELMSMFDCFVLSSYLEGLCTSIMDAQAMGTPVVATRTGGVPDLVEDGVTGLLVPTRNPDELASAIVRMHRDSKLRERCVANALDKAHTSYDARQMVDGTLDVYKNILAGVVEAN